jgi:GT2 family glycosyltransferase
VECVTQWPELAIAVPTFKRNGMLVELLKSIESQSMAPGLVVVVDNNTGREGALEVVREYARHSALQIKHLPLGENAGPAGAFSAAMVHLRGMVGIEWMMCRGDDNPFGDPDVVASMRAFADSVAHLEPAGIGNRGVTYNRATARVVAVADDSLRGVPWLSVDGLPGGGSPTYNIARVAAASANFDPFLFFGYEELDFGLQLRRANQTLLLNAPAQLQIRSQFGPLEKPPRSTSPWRAYYNYRNLLIVGRRHATATGVVSLAAKQAVKITVAAVKHRTCSRARAEFAGLLDGTLQRPARRRYIPD